MIHEQRTREQESCLDPGYSAPPVFARDKAVQEPFGRRHPVPPTIDYDSLVVSNAPALRIVILHLAGEQDITDLLAIWLHTKGDPDQDESTGGKYTNPILDARANAGWSHSRCLNEIRLCSYHHPLIIVGSIADHGRKRAGNHVQYGSYFQIRDA